MRPAPEDGLILVTGGAGYIGSALVMRLLEQGRSVRVLDPLLYGGGALSHAAESDRFELHAAEPTDDGVIERALFDASTVIHLGAMVGDPACAQNPALARALNVDSTARLVEAATRRGVRRFVFASTCSVYGAGSRELTEEAPLAPKSLYAATKVDGERLVVSSRDISPVVLRFGTLFGDSPRPRFDLVVNLLTARAAAGEPIRILGGNQWRPFVHVQDVVAALILATDANGAFDASPVFNVGGASGNLRLADLGALLAERAPEAEVIVEPNAADPRDYRANFDKIERELGFQTRWTLRDGIDELHARLRRGVYGDYRQARYHNESVLAERAPLGKIIPD